MTQVLWNYFIIGTLGMLFQIFIKISVLKKQSKAANHSFTIKGYFTDDWPTIAASLVTVWIAILCLDEWLPLNPLFAKYTKWLFAFVGFTGSSIIQVLFSVTSKKIMNIIDIKTNIADGVKPPVNAENVGGVKEIAKDKEKLNT